MTTQDSGTDAAQDSTEQPRSEQVLRRLLAYLYAGHTLYADDGELQDNRKHPLIDFKRDSVDQIECKMGERTRAEFAATPSALPSVAVGSELPNAGKAQIIALANQCGIDTDADGDIWGSTNGALVKFAAAVLRAPLPKGCAIDWTGTIYNGIPEMYHGFEAGEALHMWLDDKGVPRADADDKVFSPVGRVTRLLESATAPVSTISAEQEKAHARTTAYHQGYIAGIEIGKALAADEADSATISAGQGDAAGEQFCEGHCTWLDHQPGCPRANMSKNAAEMDMSASSVDCLNISQPTEAKGAEVAGELQRIKRMAACGTADSFLALPDQDKRYWFAQCMDESERRKLAEARLAFLHSTNKDADGWEYFVARVRWVDGKPELLWALSDHSDIDAAMAASTTTEKGQQS